MADPSLEEDGILREWAPLTHLLQQIPLKAQRGLFTHDLNLTCVDTLPEFIAVGTNLGLVYWYNRKKGDLQRLRCENTGSAITCVKVISTVDFMVAAGNDQGIVTVFQIPKIPPDSLPESMKPKKNKQVERYTISGLHSSSVTAIEWSMNGMKLFSGDRNGIVVLTEIDFYMHLSKSVELLNEKYEIVQLSYSQQLLLVSTLYRSIVCCHREDRWKVAQVGQKERKTLGRLGATFCLGSGRPQELVVYASRPGLRVWLADKNGVVQQTLIYKDALMSEHTHTPLINPAPYHVKQSHGDHQFGPLLVFRENLLVTYSSDIVYVLNPATITVVATVADLRKVQDVAVNKDEIFILEGERSLIRVAYTPETTATLVQGGKSDYEAGNIFLPVSLSEITVASSIMDLTSKLKDSAIVSAIPLPKLSTRINIFGSEYECTNSQISYETSNPVVTADEATELPPVVTIPAEELTDLNIGKIVSPGVDCVNTTDGNKVYKEVYNISQRSNTGSRRSSTLSCDNLRAEILERIGGQQYEDVVFKPKHRKRRNKKKQKKSLISGTESGSDTMSTNSVRSASDGEDPSSSERLDISSDWSVSTKQSEGSNNMQLDKRSSSEETLVRLSDCISSDIVTLSGDVCSERDGTPSVLDEVKTVKEKRPSDLSIGEEILVPSEIQPDLRSPASIERDVANKERILAKVLKLDTLCDGDSVLNGVNSCDINKIEAKELIPTKTNMKYVTSHSCILSEELTHDIKVRDQKTDDWENQCAVQDEEDSVSQHSDNMPDSQDEKLASYSSILSYGPPSGSSAPPSNHASLEIFSSPDSKTESSCDSGLYEAIERADRWMQYKVPDAIVNISVCKYYVCCVDSKDVVYYSALNGLSLKWQKLDYKARQIAVSPNGTLVWKLHKSTAYALENPSTKGPFGRRWKQAVRNVQWISLADNMAWLISDGCVFVHKQLTAEYPCSSSTPVYCNEPVTRICCFQGATIALTCTGEVLYRSGASHIVPEGKKWKKLSIPYPVVIDIALGCQNTAWIVDQKNVIHFSCNFADPNAQWWQVLISDYIFQQTTPLQQFRNKLTENLYIRQQASTMIAAGEDTVWIADKSATSVHMNKTEFTGHQWTKSVMKHHMPSLKWQKISAEGIYEDKGQLWLLSTAGDVFSSCPNSFDVHGLPLPDDSPVVCLAAAVDTVWLLTAKGKIYIRQGVSDIFVDGATWKELSLVQLDGIHLSHVSCGCDVVWACDDQGEVYMAVGSPHSFAGSTFCPVWIPVDDKLPQKISCHQQTTRKNTFTKVFVGPQTYMVWALDSKKNVYVREGIFNDYLLGTGWVLVSGIEAVDLSISGTAVWALSPEGCVYRRYGITDTNFIGDYWKRIPGLLTAVTASMSDGLWALDKNHSLLRHSQLHVKLNEHAPSSSGSLNLTADGDWEIL
ncbi:tectonin beta-propeller repeat-containing protein 2 isoform X2 [Periplaneta americana]|uniref:tectonin beta-propeller repeat-containing protein 2 isoform X2 n=1 Tax=Periplaneta americana TaxID=6978 RepID=UPI0037E7C46E